MEGEEFHVEIASGVRRWRSADARPKMRIGFLWQNAPDDVAAISGMPCAMASSLEGAGAELVPLYVPAKQRLKNLFDRGPSRLAPRAASRACKGAVKRALRSAEFAWPQLIHQRAISRASGRSRKINALLRSVDVDVVFGCCVSSILCALRTDRPIVYFSDLTAKLINDAYPAYARRCEGYKQACDEIERAALDRTTFAVFASPWAQRSAIEDYGMPPWQTRVVPLGSHISPADTSAGWASHPSRSDGQRPRGSSHRPPAPPTKHNLRLVMVAADPIRKRLDLALDTIDQLNAMGWRARLTLIGPPSRRALASAVCQTLGSLSLADPHDREAHAAALARSHLLLLPSLAEAFGIATCEAAQFGVPSIVSDAGGLPSAVLHHETGIVLPVSADARAYAEVIADLVSSPERYEAMRRRARRRAQAELTWRRWAQQMLKIFEHATLTSPIHGQSAARSAAPFAGDERDGQPAVQFAESDNSASYVGRI